MRKHRRSPTSRQGKNQTPEFFTKVTAKLLENMAILNMRAGDRIVAVVIMLHADAEGENAFPSIARIAELSGFGRRDVSRSLSRLEALGVLVRQNRRWQTSLFKISMDMEPFSAQITRKTTSSETSSPTSKETSRVCQYVYRTHANMSHGSDPLIRGLNLKRAHSKLHGDQGGDSSSPLDTKHAEWEQMVREMVEKKTIRWEDPEEEYRQ